MSTTLKKEENEKNTAYVEIAKKEMEKLEKATELKKKTEALTAKEQDLINAKSEMEEKNAEILELKVTQGDLITRINTLNEDAIKNRENIMKKWSRKM